MRALSLAIFLFAFWLALSGHYTPFLLATGVIMAIACALLAARMHILDAEGHPVHLLSKGVLSYFLWLGWEIVKSAWSVTKIILNPRLPISPTMTRIKTSQKTSVGVTVFANSITLTPGTITVGVESAGSTSGSSSGGHDILTVHALQREGAQDLEGGAMDARVARFEDA